MKSREEYNEYMRTYLAIRYDKKRKECIQKLGGACVSCGKEENLEFDHKNPSEKEYTISNILLWKNETLEKELEKCQLLCKECHFLKTLKDTGKSVAKGTHGTLSAYRYCRCSLCVAAKREYYAYRYIKKPRNMEIPHGTRAGYLKEVRRKTPTCSLCREANNVYTKELNKKNSDKTT